MSACGALLLWRLARSRRVASILLPILVPALAYLGLVTWDFQHSLARGILSNDAFDRSLWRYEAVALVALAAGVAWGLVRERRARAAVARLVVELGGAPEPGAVRAALAATLDDPGLELAYRRSGDASYVNAAGRRLELEPGPGRAVTPVLRDGEPVAALVHDERFVDQPGLLQEVLSGARVVVENERLQAEVRAQIEELQSSRARIVETGDAERRRLERDLHDGAQQRLLALSYDLRVARARAEAEGDGSVAALVAAATDEAQAAIEELRGLAHGLYPAILAEAGLAAALATLADDAPLPVELGDLPTGRFGTAVETAAYLVVAEAVEDAAARGASHVEFVVAEQQGRIHVTVCDDGTSRIAPLVHLADRVGSIGGSLESGSTLLEAEIPCG
jgi:signal transduction histidine kinase